jgi:hypothetical protein
MTESSDSGSRLLRVVAAQGMSIYPTLESGLVAYGSLSRDLLGEPPPIRMLFVPRGSFVVEVGRRGNFIQLLTPHGLGWMERSLEAVAIETVGEE